MEKMNFIQNETELEFAIFCIENVAAKLKIEADVAFDLLSKKSSILQEYIIPNYEVLHSQGKEYIVEDIIEVMKDKRVM